MGRALAQAKKAAAEGEVPVGAVIVRDGRIVSWGRNRRELGKSALLHAELVAIRRACKRLGGWRLFGCTLYVTLEPCPMCAGAIINSRIDRVVVGAMDPKAGACGSVTNLFELPFNHKPELITGLLAGECASLLTDFFRGLRQKKREGMGSENQG